MAGVNQRSGHRNFAGGNSRNQISGYVMIVVLLFNFATGSSSRPLVNSCCQSISILSFEMSKAGGSNLFRVGQGFQFVRRQFFLEYVSRPLFPFISGHETNAKPLLSDLLLNILVTYSVKKKVTYQLSSVGAGRGRDGDPFFSHRPEVRL